MSKYNYSSIKELSSKKEAYFYGIITDATFPALDEQENVYSCTLKLIDHTVNHITESIDIQSHQIYLTIKSDLIENLPFVQHVGDIIRVHRGSYVHKLKRNVYCNLETKGPMKSHWCIFAAGSDPSSKSYEAISCSSRTYTIEDIDYQMISNLRSWVVKHLKEKGSLVYSKTVKLIDRNREVSDEKDLIVQVCHKMKNTNDSISFWVQDDTDGCEMVVYNIYNYIYPEMIIRIRSFKTYQKNIIVLNNFSNMLILPSFSQLYEAFAYKLLSKKSKVKLDTPEIESNLNARNTIISFKESQQLYPNRKLNEIRFEDTKFWMEVSILSYSDNLISWYDHTTNKSFEENKKGKNLTPYFNASFIATDEEFGSSSIKLYLSSYDGNGEGFLGSALDVSKNDKKAKETLKKLIDHKNSVKVLVEAVQSGTNYGDKIFRIIGTY
jgi:hypothetical protein